MTSLPTPAGSVWIHRFPGRRPPVVALHGFTLDGGSLAELSRLTGRAVIAPDLPGHGRTEILPASLADGVAAVRAALEGEGMPLPLLGYSQGGRVALHIALAAPSLVSRLILLSTGPGIIDPRRREARRAADEARARFIEREGVGAFVDRWLESPMFERLRRDPDWTDSERGRRQAHDPVGLAEALRGMGQGSQAPLQGEMRDLQMPVLVLVGELDVEYRRLGKEIVRRASHSRLEVIAGAGHPLLAERLVDVARVVEAFLSDGEAASGG